MANKSNCARMLEPNPLELRAVDGCQNKASVFHRGNRYAASTHSSSWNTRWQRVRRCLATNSRRAEVSREWDGQPLRLVIPFTESSVRVWALCLIFEQLSSARIDTNLERLALAVDVEGIT